MDFEKVKTEVRKIARQVKDSIKEYVGESKKNMFPKGTFEQVIVSRLRVLLSNPKENPILTSQQMEEYYFGANGLMNIQEKYLQILELQDIVLEETLLPVTFDKFIILKILGLSISDYNTVLSDALSGINARDESICSIFIDIENMLISERNSSAENNVKNVKAVDMVNRYNREYGGYAVRAVNDKEKETTKKEIYFVSNEEVEKKLANNFGFSKQLENKGKEKK